MAKKHTVENLMDMSIIQDVMEKLEGRNPAQATPFLLQAILIELRIANGRTPTTADTTQSKQIANKVFNSLTNFRA